MSKADKKIEFIKSWYITECSNLSFGDKLKLAKVWIDICIKDEEYEMASSIKDERKKIIDRHIKEKRKKRRLSQRIVVALYLLNRKISTWFKSKR